MYIGSWKLSANVTFYCNTHDPSTGAATDADSVPTYRVYEDETSTPLLTGSMALLDSANTAGFYSEQITVSSGNGFEQGKSYNIYISATVGGITATISRYLQIAASVDVNYFGSSLITSASGIPEVKVASLAADSITAAAIAADAIGSSELAATAASEIATAVAALNCTEPTAVVAASPTLIAALSWLLTQSRNKITQTATTQILKADDGSTTIATSTLSDDGTTATRGEFA